MLVPKRSLLSFLSISSHPRHRIAGKLKTFHKLYFPFLDALQTSSVPQLCSGLKA
jgi:hypothetical protein